MLTKYKLLFALMLLFSCGLTANAQLIDPNGVPTPCAGALTMGNPSPVNGFPESVTTNQGFSLGLCTDGDGITGPCFMDPVIFGNAFSEQIGFGAEAFWWLGEAMITDRSALLDPTLEMVGNVPLNGINALLVEAVEAAFLTEEPVPGDQFPFTRTRFFIDVPYTGKYIITDPYGEQTFNVPAIVANREIRLTIDNAIVESSHCDFNGQLLRWTDPDYPVIINGNYYIGNPNIPHRVTGSPTGNNFFRIQFIGDQIDPITGTDPRDFTVTTYEFSVMGKIFSGNVQSPLSIGRSTYARDNTGAGQIEIFANSQIGALLQIDAGTSVGGPYFMKPDGFGGFQSTFSVLDLTNLPAALNVSADNSSNNNVTAFGVTSNFDKTTLPVKLEDVVTISKAVYDAVTQTLSVVASSSDQYSTLTVPAPSLTVLGFGDMTNGVLNVPFVTNPPALVEVVSTAGGYENKLVTCVNLPAPTDVVNPTPVSTLTVSTEANTPLVGGIDVITGTTPGGNGTSVNLLSVVTPSTNGALVTNAGDTITYNPPQNYIDVDTFNYVIANDIGGTAVGTVTVNVTTRALQEAPIATTDIVTADAGVALVIDVLANDVDLNGDAISISTYQTTTGNASIAQDPVTGELIYTSNAGFFGLDTFTYTVFDGIASTTGIVEVTVSASPVTENITFQTATYKAGKGEWKVGGTSDNIINNTITLYVGSVADPVNLLGTAQVDPDPAGGGQWDFKAKDSNVAPIAGNQITAVSTGGATRTVGIIIN